MDSVQSQIRRDVDTLKGALPALPQAVARPYVVLVCGLPGTGKSYISGILDERLPVTVLETDALRKALFPTPQYDAIESSRLFQACHLLIEELLLHGIPVLLDATNLVERHREHIYSIADRLQVKMIIVLTKAPVEQVRSRLEDRARELGGSGNSDADWAVYQRMRSSEQPIRRNHFVVDTSRDVMPVVDKIIREVNIWNRA